MPACRLLFAARSSSVASVFPKLKEEGVEVAVAESARGVFSSVEKNKPALIFSEIELPGFRVEELLARAAATTSFPPVIVFTERGTAAEAQKLMEMGAKDYWLAPLTWDRVKAVLPIEEGFRPKVVSREQERGWQIIGEHPAMRKVMALAKQVAGSKATVLISGESGTGKELFARFIHNQSDRKNQPFIALNCAALPEHLLESELFGHEKGSFTGAIGRKLGKFELAHGGTLLLDEISEMDLGLQAKLLRVLQEGEIDRVGGSEVVSVDVRVLATTNRQLEDCVATGTFRQDLYYRLNVIPLRLPSLKERPEDIPVLVQYFVRRSCRENGLPDLGITTETMDWLTNYTWPGNVRELQNLMERAVLLAGKGPIATRHFLMDGGDWEAKGQDDGEEVSTAGSSPASQFEAGDILPLAEMEQRLILKSLSHTSGNRTQAAELLGISVRTLRNKLNEYRDKGIIVP